MLYVTFGIKQFCFFGSFLLNNCNVGSYVKSILSCLISPGRSPFSNISNPDSVIFISEINNSEYKVKSCLLILITPSLNNSSKEGFNSISEFCIFITSSNAYLILYPLELLENTFTSLRIIHSIVVNRLVERHIIFNVYLFPFKAN